MSIITMDYIFASEARELSAQAPFTLGDPLEVNTIMLRIKDEAKQGRRLVNMENVSTNTLTFLRNMGYSIDTEIINSDKRLRVFNTIKW